MAEKRDKKLRKAIEAGARMVSKSTSKIAWDMGHDKVRITSGKLDYRVHQILDCVHDKIAQGHWFGQVLGLRDDVITKEPDRYIVIIEGHEFKNFVANQGLTSRYLCKIFKKLPKIILEGDIKIPFCLSENRWLNIENYEDNIFGVAVSYEQKEFEEYRSKRKMRGKGVGKEEPVFILLFHTPYGLAFFRDAMRREGAQLQDPDLYHLLPKAQELFQSIRWNDGLIVLTTERASKIMNLKWPVSNKARLYERVKLIRKILKILKDNEFINYNDKTCEQGRTIERKAWAFYVRKRKLIKNERIFEARFTRENVIPK